VKVYLFPRRGRGEVKREGGWKEKALPHVDTEASLA
jgi:hypothetical protein